MRTGSFFGGGGGIYTLEPFNNKSKRQKLACLSLSEDVCFFSNFEMSMSWLWDIGFPSSGSASEGSEGSCSSRNEDSSSSRAARTARTMAGVMVRRTMVARRRCRTDGCRGVFVFWLSITHETSITLGSHASKSGPSDPAALEGKLGAHGGPGVCGLGLVSEL